MTLDDELRDALQAEADQTQDVADAWGRLQERAGQSRPKATRWLLPGLAAAVVTMAAVGAWLVLRDDDVQVDVGGETTTVPAPVTTRAAPSTSAASATSLPPTTTLAPATTQVTPPVAPTTMIAVTLDGRVVVLDAGTGAEVRELANLGDPRVEAPEGPGPNAVTQLAVTPDGSRVFYDSCCEPAVGAIFEVPTDGSRPPELLTMGQGPAVSPDGRYLAYTAIDTVIVRDLTDGTERTFSDPAYTEAPLAGDLTWSPDGRRLYYPWTRRTEQGITSALVEVDVAAGFPPRVVTEVSGRSLEDPLVLEDGRVSLLSRPVGLDGLPGAQDTELLVDVATGQAVPGPSVGVADWGNSRTGARLVVLEDGRLLSGDQILGTGFALAVW